MTRGCKALPVLVIGSLLAACGNSSHPTRGSVRTSGPSMTSTATSTIAPTLSPTAQPAVPTPARTQGPASTPPQNTSSHNPSPPTRPHVLLIMLENKGYGATLGSCAADSYLCSLASQYMSATAWYSVGHPSLPNYLAVTSGSTQGCSGDTCSVGISATDLGGQLTTAGIPWQAYMESMPSACDDIASNGAYTRVHNPFAYFTDNASSCRDVPYPGAGGLLAALDGSAAPDFVWISPNLNDDMHNGSVEQGDAWLRANLAPVLELHMVHSCPRHGHCHHGRERHAAGPGGRADPIRGHLEHGQRCRRLDHAWQSLRHAALDRGDVRLAPTRGRASPE